MVKLNPGLVLAGLTVLSFFVGVLALEYTVGFLVHAHAVGGFTGHSLPSGVLSIDATIWWGAAGYIAYRTIRTALALPLRINLGALCLFGVLALWVAQTLTL